uniref:Putative transposase n=1 Tax=Pseudomonas savastanoi pv. phaseolicola TaxID=319 RepID=Q5QFZ3_PSESH|nr:putative transposase [Pseudomonas savastanoi pv. phaseolicola]
MGGLVQSPPPAGANRSYSTGRGRSHLLSATHRVCPGGMTQTKGSPRNPGRFILASGSVPLRAVWRADGIHGGNQRADGAGTDPQRSGDCADEVREALTGGRCVRT